MITEVELLKQDIPRLERTFGAHHLFVEVLKQDLASQQKCANPLEEQQDDLMPFFKWSKVCDKH